MMYRPLSRAALTLGDIGLALACNSDDSGEGALAVVSLGTSGNGDPGGDGDPGDQSG